MFPDHLESKQVMLARKVYNNESNEGELSLSLSDIKMYMIAVAINSVFSFCLALFACLIEE